jgi:hypothetical protein
MDSYIKIGWHKCQKCGKEKYVGDDTEFTHFDLGELELNNLYGNSDYKLVKKQNDPTRNKQKKL